MTDQKNNGCLVRLYRLYLLTALKCILPLFMVCTMFMVPSTSAITLIWAAVCMALFMFSKESYALSSYALPAFVTVAYVVVWEPLFSANYGVPEPPPAFLLYSTPFLCLLLFSHIGSFLRSKTDLPARMAARKDKQKIAVQRETDTKKENRTWKIAGISSGIILILAVSASILVSLYTSAKQYEAAEQLISEGEYLEAQNAFYAMNYKDSRSRAASLQPQVLSSVQSGDIIHFGTFQNEPVTWIVLERNGDKLYLLSEKCLAYRTRCGTEGDVDFSPMPMVTHGNWDTSKLRIWLNDTFLNTAFTEQEQLQILETQVISDKYEMDPDRLGHHIHVKGIETTDKIFLLSESDVFKYTNQSQYMSDLIFKASATAASAGAGDNEYPEWALLDAGFSLVTYSAFSDKYYVSAEAWSNSDAYARPVLWLSTTE